MRHADMFMRAAADARTDGDKFRHALGDDQGFVDGEGEYLTRIEKLEVAITAGQITHKHGCKSELFSEDVY